MSRRRQKRAVVASACHRPGGVKISRQVPVGPFIVDFVARDARLVIEIDGGTHVGRTDYDARRTGFLEQQGYRVIRFTNNEVMSDIEGVGAAITAALASPLIPHPTLSPQEKGLPS